MVYTKTIVKYVLVPALFYPIYFIIANFIDSLFGNQHLIVWMQFESPSLLLNTFFKDWFSSLPTMFGIFYLLILPAIFLNTKFGFNRVLTRMIIPAALMCLFSYILGFGYLGIITNSLSVFMFVLFYLTTQKIWVK